MDDYEDCKNRYNTVKQINFKVQRRYMGGDNSFRHFMIYYYSLRFLLMKIQYENNQVYKFRGKYGLFI